MTAQLSLLPAFDRFAPTDSLDRLLATPADQTVLGNLPEFADADAFERFVFGHVAMLDASGPVSALRGSTFDRWREVRSVLALAWAGRPRRERPLICTMARPRPDREQRSRIRHAARHWPWERRP